MSTYWDSQLQELLGNGHHFSLGNENWFSFHYGGLNKYRE